MVFRELQSWQTHLGVERMAHPKSTETEVKGWFQELVEGEDGELMSTAGIPKPRPWTVPAHGP